MTDIHAKISNLSLSAQKVRLVIDMVRGKSANEASGNPTLCKQTRSITCAKVTRLCCGKCRRKLWRKP